MKRNLATLTGNTTITLSMSNDQDLLLLLVQGGTGSYTVTWSGVTKWFTPSGSAPTLQTAVGASDLVQFFRTGGSVYGIHWGDTGPAGSTGATGPAGIVWRRAWSPTTTYVLNDVVSLNGSSYIALQGSSATNSQQPDVAPTYWGLLAQGGTSATTASSETVDSFIRANVSPLSSDTGGAFTYASVTGKTGVLAISSNLCVNTLHTNNDAFYRASPVLSSVDHHAQVTLGAVAFSGSGSTFQANVCCRMDSSAATFYDLLLAGNTTAGSYSLTIRKQVAGVDTQLAAYTSFTSLPAVGDKIKLTVAGTTLTGYYNGTQVVQVTDSAITSGFQCGLGSTQQNAGTTCSFSEFRFGV